MNNYIFTFSSTHKVLKAESLLKESSIAFRLDPAPSDFTDYCELVISINADYLDKALKTLESKTLSPKSIYKKTSKGYIKA